MANGKVHVFNVFSETIINFMPNGLSAGSVPGWSKGPEPPLYTPASLAVERVLNPNEAPGKFYDGLNNVIFNWPSGTFHLSVQIDGTRFPITQNLLLFVMQNKWYLVNEFGVEVESGDVTFGPAFGFSVD